MLKAGKLFFSILFFLFSIVSFAQDNQKIVSIANEMNYDYFYKHLSYFASDELEGRDAASEGYQKAADYTAAEFKNIGLLPMGDNDTYFQKVSLVKIGFMPSSFQMSVENEKGKIEGIYGENFTAMLTSDKEEAKDFELVFVGHGIVIPEKNIDDYKGLDVKGKVVIVAAGAPKDLNSPRLQNPFAKSLMALSKGAKGVIYFNPSDEGQDQMFKRFHGFMSQPRMRIADGSPYKSMIDMDLVVHAKKDFVNAVLASNNINLKRKLKAMSRGKFVSKALSSNIKYSYKVKNENSDCKNIVALLPGTDPQLKNEYIVVSAHLDHVGIGRAINGDSIYNGMWDNASGSASVISIAKEFQKNKLPSKRSIIFVCYTAEEKGLLGSKFFAQSDIVKDKKMVANLNIDMLGSLFETTDITPEGYSHSNLSEGVDFAVKALNLTISDPTKFEKEYMERSDNISLIRIGVPAMNFSSGQISIDPEFNVVETIDQWMKKTYHSPFDDLNQEYSDKAFHMYLKANFLFTYYVANEMGEIKWNKDEWVYKKYLGEKSNEK